MTDYGRPLQFGLFVTPRADMLDNTLALAALADRHLDFIAVQDHAYQAKFLDSWALMATVLARTQRVKVIPDVASLPLRPPAVLAKTAASLDVISGGRFELALGAGAFWQAIAAMGGPNRTPGEAAQALEEAVEVIRLMWSDQRSVRFQGEHYRLSGVHPGPAPAHDIQIWLGVGGPRMLRFLGTKADGWVPSNSYFPPDKLPAMQRQIDDAALAAGRDPSAIVRAYNIFGAITRAGDAEAFRGSVAQWTDELTALSVETGMDTFLFGTADDDAAQAAVFADEIVPAVREAVARHRGD
ncbi:LLM class flavin-dependent oxidoreductase [Mycolicibacterium fortuitum]|uniref:LLM class flavin-dependent oxidoreductase n=1 Tax=Mycolicibacterium fortuitum TaxID=1766 RepID=UPI001CDCF8E2|nr:LLM class flavin-dependent oxidoreductase [Mycolicibacterium fortuitum]UBV21897.1 LLM class flavin-dependent oxidoreductase [Mycolicibacterium fortuitum]